MEDVRQVQRSRVRDYMTSDPQTLDVQSTLLDAVLMMRRSELRHIPILENDRLVGILTDRDVGRFAPSMLLAVSPQDYNRVFEDTPISKVMTRNLFSTTPEVKLAEAVNLIQDRFGFGHHAEHLILERVQARSPDGVFLRHLDAVGRSCSDIRP